MNDNIIICRTSAEELEMIASLEEKVFSDPWNLSVLSSSFENDSYIFLTAMNEKNQLAGYVIGLSSWGEAELLRIAVEPAARRCGVGRKLMSCFIDVINERKDDKIFLEVRESNDSAIALYSAFGFKKYAVRNGYYKKPTENAVMMSLELCK